MRRRELLLVQHLRLLQLGRKAALEIIQLPLDAHHAALAGGLELFEERIVAEDRAAEGTAAVAEIRGKKRVPVGGGLAGELLDHKHARECAAGSLLDGLEFADGRKGKFVGHDRKGAED